MIMILCLIRIITPILDSNRSISLNKEIQSVKNIRKVKKISN